METLFSLTDPEKIYLHVGAPDASLLPVDLIRKTNIMQQDLVSSLQYGPSQGSESVREELSQFLSREYKSQVDKDHLLVTSGASQSFYNMIPIFTNSETVFIMENPTYFLAWKMLNDHGIKNDSIIGISSDENGLDVDALEAYLLSTLVPSKGSEESLASNSKKKFRFLLYLVPTFGNPTGASLSMERRKKLIDLARTYDILVVCDDVYHLIYFENQMPPDRLVSLDLNSLKEEEGNVISNCSFSKLFSPGFRLGWIEASPFLLNQLKNSGILNSGGCSNHFSSFLMKPILKSSDFSSHLQGIRKEYESRRDLLLQEFKKLPSQFTVSSPKGGFFIWITDTTKNLDSKILLENISKSDDADYKVTFTPGNSFSANNAHGHCMRVSFGMYRGTELITGAQRLVNILTQTSESQIFSAQE